MLKNIHLILETRQTINMTPKEEITQLIQWGKALQTQAEQAFTTGLHSNGASIIGEFFIGGIPQGQRGLARNLGKTIQRSDRQKNEIQWREKGKQLLSNCEFKIKQMSINTKNLTKNGNSPKLVQKFNRVRRVKSSIASITEIIAILEELQNIELLWNTDIPNELVHRKEITDMEKREKTNLLRMSPRIIKNAGIVDIFDRLAISDQLEQYPSVKSCILGAFDRLHENAPDSARHCIISCRVAIESFCIESGNDADWKNALKNVLSSDTDRRQIIGIWNYLSGKGAHGGHFPTKEEAEYCLQLTIGTLTFIIKGSSKKNDIIRQLNLV